MDTSSSVPDSDSERGRRAPRLGRFALLVLPAALFIGILVVSVVKDADKPVVGSEAPEFTAAYLDGPGSLEFSSLSGKPVLLNFWASWCVPCEDEAPLLESAYARYRDDIEFVGIDIRDARDDAIQFVERFGVTYPQVRDEGMRIEQDYGLTGQPETFFIDQDGIVVQHVKGPLNESALYQYLDVLVSRNA